ncbi:hypothetical protein [Paremcibacter congregatus]|uniref:hypothetical protein n=1 Tax=Paremcibacter congregatus TaxID=2043170 RepID=UPI0013FE3EC4|nr:hypothetical protein [Paremcibacter congregatus]
MTRTVAFRTEDRYVAANGCQVTVRIMAGGAGINGFQLIKAVIGEVLGFRAAGPAID